MPDLDVHSLKLFLDSKAEQYNRPDFIKNDPIVIPHKFSLKQDVEIMGFFAAMLAWGQRITIINKCNELIGRMGGEPYSFIKNHSDEDLKALLGFKHRTFNDTDLLYFVHFFKEHYSRFDSLEDAFLPSSTGLVSAFRTDFERAGDAPQVRLSSAACYQGELNGPGEDIEALLNHFRAYFFCKLPRN